MTRRIKGITNKGNKFRPSSWAEMLVHGVETHDNKICIEICELDGKCVRICKSLDGSEEAERLLQFARDNDLVIVEEDK